MVVRPRHWLCVPVVALSTLDLVLTLAGQSSAYWEGDRLAAQEANPLARACLHGHPLALVGLAGVGTAVVGAVLWLVPLRLAAACAFVPSFLHAVAAAAWCLTWGGWGWGPALGVLVGATRLVKWSWHQAGLGGPGK